MVGTYFSVFILALLLQLSTQDSSAGFTAQDRFQGFRFKVTGTPNDFASLQTHVRKAAKSLSCFGWVQQSPADTLVGEARCNKKSAYYMREYLHRELSPFYPDIYHTLIHVYDDTNIKLHFSDFRKLDQGRQTCFDSGLHACSDYGTADASAVKSEL